MRFTRHAAVCVFLALCSSTAYADTSTDNIHITLQAALVRVSNANPEILIAQQELKQSRMRILRIAPPPLTGVASSLITHDVPGGIGVYHQADLALAQDLPAPRQLRAERMSAEADVRQSVVALITAQRAARLRAIDAFFQVTTAQNTRELALSDLALTRASRDMAKARARAGDVAQLDVLRGQADVDRAIAAERNAEKDVLVAQLALKQLLGIPSAQVITVDVPSLFSQTADQPVDVKDSNILARNQYDATQRQIDSLVNRARFVQSPTYSLSLGVQAIRSIRPSAIAYGPSMNISVKFPVVDHGTVRGSIAEAEAARGVAYARLTAQIAEYQTAVQTRMAEIVLASERLTSAKASLIGTQAAQRLTDVGYQRGKLGFVDVLSARASFLQARAVVHQALVDEMRAAAELNELRSTPTTP
jgi:multidrug efflux system outer membrane protein